MDNDIRVTRTQPQMMVTDPPLTSGSAIVVLRPNGAAIIANDLQMPKHVTKGFQKIERPCYTHSPKMLSRLR